MPRSRNSRRSAKKLLQRRISDFIAGALVEEGPGEVTVVLLGGRREHLRRRDVPVLRLALESLQ